MSGLLHPTSRRALLLAPLGLAITPKSAGAVAFPDELQERILVFGDSQAQGLAGGFQRLYRGDKSRRVLDRSKISTGIIPRPGFDWPAQAQVLATIEKADVAVALFGANDRPPIRRGGEIDPVLLDRFTETYGARVQQVAEVFRTAKVPLIWVGHPIVRDPIFAQDMQIIDDIFEERAVGVDAVFVSTWDTFKGADGNYSPYGKGVDGQTTRLRADDGVHLTPAGYDVVTALLVPLVDKYRPPA